ncbi:MAG: LPS export ABC transporter permease LptG [Caulobacterales bacterium]|nr:LPS export ABC transporter permease LptG [Caulobacterales bacterium]
MSSTLLFRYVMLQMAGGVALAFGIIVAMIVLIDFVELSRSLGSDAQVGALGLLALALLHAPLLVETTLPFIFLFGAMWGMFRLNRHSELIVMRAAGVSAWRFLLPCIALSMLAGVFATAAYNPAAARLNDEFERRRDLIDNPDGGRIGISETGVWLREARDDGQFVIRAGRSEAGGQRLHDVTVYIYENDRLGEPVFSRRLDASEAVLRASFWQLSEAWEYAPDVQPLAHATISLPTELEPRRLLERFGSPNALNFWELRRQADLLRQAGFAASDYDLRWHRLLATPITLTAMTILAAAVSLRLTRRGGAFLLAVSGAVLGFGLFFTENMLAALGSSGVLPIALAAWAAPCFALLAGVFVVAGLEDG